MHRRRSAPLERLTAAVPYTPMVQGILLSLASGLLFGTVGVILRRVSRAGGNLVTYYVLFGTFYLALALLFQVRWRVVAGVDRLPMLALVIGLAGVVSGLGMLLMTRSMALGHGGISWAISQSALVVPFLAGVLLEGDRAGLGAWAGLALVLAMIAVLGRRPGEAEAGSPDVTAAQRRGPWIASVAGAFAALGVSQALSSIPSRWNGWTDAAGLRVALSAAGFLVPQLVLFLFTKDRRPGRLVPLLALAHGVVGFLGQAALFASLDRLAPYGLAAAAFPVSIGTTIVSFSLYSALVLRERFRALDIASLAAGSAGIALLALTA
jgi:drug/metabolite transporter (DMT)-like permease